MKPFQNFHHSNGIRRSMGVVPIMIRNRKVGDGSRPELKLISGNKQDFGQTNKQGLGNQPTLPIRTGDPPPTPPWETSGAISVAQFCAELIPWISITLGHCFVVSRELYIAATTGTGTPMNRILSILPENMKDIYDKFTQRTGQIAKPLAFANCVAVLLGFIAIFHKAKHKKQYTFSDYYYAHAGQDNQIKDWMKDIFISPAAMQNLSHEFWSSVKGLARAMAEADKTNGKIEGEIFADTIKEAGKILDWHTQIIGEIKKKKSIDDPDIINLIAAYQTELDKICQLRAAINNTTKSANDIVDDFNLTHEAAMDEMIDLLTFQTTMTHKNRNGQKDTDKGVLYWLNQFIENGPNDPAQKNERIKKAGEFWTMVNQHAQWLGFRPQDSTARLYAVKFLRLLAFGTAEEVWNNAAGHYQECRKASPAVATMLPDYLEAMEQWARKNPEKAKKNFLAHQKRYPALPANSTG